MPLYGDSVFVRYGGAKSPFDPCDRCCGEKEREDRLTLSHTQRERVRLLQRHSWSGIAQHSFSHSFPLPQLGHRRRLAVSRRVSCACETFSFPDERRCSIIIIIIIVSSSSPLAVSGLSGPSPMRACARITDSRCQSPARASLPLPSALSLLSLGRGTWCGAEPS